MDRGHWQVAGYIHGGRKESDTTARAHTHEASPSNSCRVVDSSWLVLEIDWREDTEGSGLKSGKMGWSTSLLHTYVLL